MFAVANSGSNNTENATLWLILHLFEAFKIKRFDFLSKVAVLHCRQTCCLINKWAVLFNFQQCFTTKQGRRIILNTETSRCAHCFHCSAAGSFRHRLYILILGPHRPLAHSEMQGRFIGCSLADPTQYTFHMGSPCLGNNGKAETCHFCCCFSRN